MSTSTAALLDEEQCPEAAAAPIARPTVTLTAEQSAIANRVLDDFQKRKLRQVTLGGYAGTGKTTLIRTLLAQLRGWAVCAYTGKAANVLRRKGVPASTIHSLIYKPDEDSFGRTTWVLRDDLSCRGIVVDEASMVSDVIYNDLRKFGLPILFVGDHGQLEPVGSTFNLMQAPDYRLETIHRNAGAIALFADALRRDGLEAVARFQSGDEITFVPQAELTVRRMAEADQVCVGLNSTRVKANAAIRAARGFTGLINAGERVMCLRNNRDAGLFNGLQATVTAVREGNRFDLEADGRTYEDIRFEPSQFGCETAPPYVRGAQRHPFDYAYAATCHKLQGDEADTVLVIVQKVGTCDVKRWAYTAATRARKHLVWVMG